MAPPRKKQKKSANEPKQPNILQSAITTPVSRQLPGEVLQTIFRYLPFSYLLCCTRVCKVWRAYLPGDDPVLKEMLFLESRKTSTKPFHITFDIEVRGTVARLQADVLPQLIYGLRVQTRHSVFQNPDPNIWHPAIRGPKFYLDIVNENITSMHLLNESSDHIAFSTLDELQRKTSRQQFSKHEDVSWLDMLLCVPAVKELDVTIHWRHSGRWYKRKLKNPQHIRVKDLVEYLRSALEHAAGYVEEDAQRVILDLT
jgi:hypothetical protein